MLKNRQTKTKYYFLITLVLLFFVVLFHKYKTTNKLIDNKVAPLLLIKDDITQIKKENFTVEIPVSGILYPLEQTTVVAKVKGEVKTVTVREGESVKQNQILAQLDTIDLQQPFLEQTANLAAKQASYIHALSNSKRYKQLLTKKFVSQSDYDRIVNDVKVNEANLIQAKAAVKTATLQLDYTNVKSVIPGTISERTIEPGVNVQVGDVLFKIVNLDQLEFKAQVPAEKINKIAKGQRSVFKVPGTTKSFKGKVTRINPNCIPGMRAYYVYITFDNPHHELLSGMFAFGTIIILEHENTLKIPYEALHKDKHGYYVNNIEQGIVKKKYVMLGVTDRSKNKAEVLQGLMPESTIIVSNLNIQPGTKVMLPNRA